MAIGQKIATARRRKGLTQEALAEQVGVTRQAVAKWERDQGHPSAPNMARLSEILDVAIKDLEGDFGTVQPPDPGLQENAKEQAFCKVSMRAGLVMLIAYWAILTLIMLVAGVGYTIGITLLLLILLVGAAIAGLLHKGGESATPAALLKKCGICLGILLAGEALVLMIWCVRFDVTSDYHAKGVWGIPLSELAENHQVSSWILDCENRGQGLYMISIEMPEGVTRCLVFRNEISDGRSGKISASPLSYSFTVHYGAGNSAEKGKDCIDLLEFSGARDYREEFRLAGQGEIQATQFWDTIAYQAEIETLWEKYFTESEKNHLA